MYSTEISCVKIENLYNFILVLTTYPSKETTYRIAKSILHERLAVCTSITTEIESLFWWKGNLGRTAEVVLIIKTRAALLEQLVSRLKELHPY